MVSFKMDNTINKWISDLPVFSARPDSFSGIFYEKNKRDLDGKKGIFISGPSRNGNHLVHSLLDDHPELPRISGEDSVLNELFYRFDDDFKKTDFLLRESDVVDFMTGLSGKGVEDKWAELYKAGMNEDNEIEQLWSGMYFGQGKRNFLYDYQDTIVEVDYLAFRRYFSDKIKEIFSSREPSLHDIYVEYMRALSRLDPEYSSRSRNYTVYDGISFGSGARGNLEWLMSISDYVHAIVPIRPFDSYYYSFAKGFYNSHDVRPDIIQEAWEHWHHKVADYLRMKILFPDRVCIINFESVIQDTEAAMKKICRFLKISFSETCLAPSVLGQATKGNSSFPKEESERGSVYAEPLKRRLDQSHWPEETAHYWDAVLACSENA